MLRKTYHLALPPFLGIIPLFFIFVLSFFIFISCGDGGGGGGDGDNDDDTTFQMLVSGYVFDIDGNPISGAKVTISSDPVTVYTNIEGYFSAGVDFGSSHEITIAYGAIEIYAFTLIFDENHPLHTLQINTTYDPDCNCSIWYRDADEDGYGDLSDSIESESIPSGYVTDNTDCNDNAAEVNPGAIEICDDDIDNDCDGYTDCTEPSNMALIPSGCFEMGKVGYDGISECVPPVYVCITSDFYMDIHEVTNAEYAACVSAGRCATPEYSYSATRSSYYGDQTYENFPVMYVSWRQAYDYCRWAGKRLPTEAEWEYAARGGLSGKRYPWGDDISGTDANFRNSGDPWDNDTSPVECYAPNGYGLYDVAGNVREWVNDFFSCGYYGSGPVNDPPGPDWGSFQVIRGGSWYGFADDLRVWWRHAGGPDAQVDRIGFRCAGD